MFRMRKLLVRQVRFQLQGSKVWKEERTYKNWLIQQLKKD